MNFKKIASLVLAVALGLTPVIMTSCDDNKGPERGDASAITDLPPSFGDELRDFEGMKFNVLTKTDRAKSQSFNITDLVGGKENLGDEAVVEAVETRNANLYAVFNFQVARINKGDAGADPAAHAREAYNQQNKTYKAFMTSVSSGLSLACEGILVDMMYSNYIDFEREYWDDAIINNLLLNGGAYIALGDINVVDDECTMCILFNKEIWKELSGKEPKALYDEVKAGNWTIEKLENYASTYYKSGTESSMEKYDPNYQSEGTYGIMVEDGDTYVWLQASGNTVSKQNEDATYGFVDNMKGNEEFSKALKKLYSFFEDKSKSDWRLNASTDVDMSMANDVWDTVIRRAMRDDKFLFYFNHVTNVRFFRDMESDFGVLPIPKLSDNQEEYGNTIQYENANCYSIPNYTQAENEKAEYILEAMCYYSSSSYFEAIGSDTDRSLHYAFRINVLERKSTRDEESMEMLDLIFNNRIFDIAIALNLKDVKDEIIDVCTSTGNYAALTGLYGNSFDNQIKNKLNKLLS